MQEPDWDGMLAEFPRRDSTTPIRRDALRRILEMDLEREPTGHLLPRYWEDLFPTLTGEPHDQYKPLRQAVIATVMIMDINTVREMASPSLTSLQRQCIISGFLKDLTDGDMDMDSGSIRRRRDKRPTPRELWAIHCRTIFSSKNGGQRQIMERDQSEQAASQLVERGLFRLQTARYQREDHQGLNPNGFTTRYTRVKLQFHWMPRRKDIASTATPLDISKNARPQDFSDLFGKTYGDLETSGLNPVFAQDRQSSLSHRVQTGDIFYVKFEHHYAERMLSDFRIQWAAIKISSLAVGAESLDDVGDSADYLDKNLN
ncbi:hypothetical protein B0T24DRAFT_708842 [Lasiosphaeria ovina]|uniref:HNH nuclease domain-containing protein n=1 Tax=Lasiosphaeria ovina TaxID=92902 RepID=A0AAE0JYE6_9PEZI|nr:hypothetical protein B0T24DRAFT_708842 [Lasiosphaeria ovina]